MYRRLLPLTLIKVDYLAMSKVFLSFAFAKITGALSM